MTIIITDTSLIKLYDIVNKDIFPVETQEAIFTILVSFSIIFQVLTIRYANGEVVNHPLRQKIHFKVFNYLTKISYLLVMAFVASIISSIFFHYFSLTLSLVIVTNYIVASVLIGNLAILFLKWYKIRLVVPPINDRYHSFQFLDAYTNNYDYLGQRASGDASGTYLIAGPDWNGQVPDGMTKIWTPTNLAWLVNRILVKGPADVPNVNAIQDKIVVKPLSVFQANTNTSSQPLATLANSSKEIPIGPQPSLIAPTGIEIFDEIGAAMIGNPLNPPDPVLVTKLASIGIGPGKTPSTEANDTIKTALQNGITEGQKLIDARVANFGTVVNGWLSAPQAGVFGTDYLFRAADTQYGLGANIAQEAFYPLTFTDSQGKPLSGNSSYLIHFEPEQTPPVDAFWSITMYNDKGLFADNPINRYSIGKYTEGLKNNTDGSLDIYVQNANPGADNESNWLPSAEGVFSMVLRMYLPQPQALNGTWQLPLVQKVG